MPETSIVIRTFNEERHIGNLLLALRQQKYHDYEIIVVDSGSIDGTLRIAKQFADKVISIPSHDFTFGYSLNVGCQKSSGAYIILVSAHTLPVDREWLSNLIQPFAEEDVAMVFGRQIGTKQNTLSEQRDLKRLFGTHAALYPHNANSAIKKAVWQQHPFDEYLLGLEDIEWGKYAERKGLRVVYKPEAAIYHIHYEKQPQVFNRYRREAIAAARLGLPHPPQFSPSFSWFCRHLAGDLMATLADGISRARLSEIFNFRYQQWRGTRQGWIRDRHMDLGPEKYKLHHLAVNQSVQVAAPGSAQLKELPLPEIKPSEVLIQVAYSGVCATDLAIYEGRLEFCKCCGGESRQYPIIPGHEFSGTIMKIGANARNSSFKIGDAVAGQCTNGSYAKYIALPTHEAHGIGKTTNLKSTLETKGLTTVVLPLKQFKKAWKLHKSHRHLKVLLKPS